MSFSSGKIIPQISPERKINVTDITLVAAYVKGKRIPADEEQSDLADVNRDGKLTVTDITKIAAHSKGKKILAVNEEFVIPELAEKAN